MIIIAIFVTIIVVAIVRSIGSEGAAAISSAQDSASPIKELAANVVAKRSQVSGWNKTVTQYFATFEFGDGQRLELYLWGSAFGLLAEGDRGMLRYQGERFLGFRRQI